MGTFDGYYSLVGVLIPENRALWWQSTYNALYLEDTYQDAAQHLSPFPNTLIAPGFGGKQGDNFHPDTEVSTPSVMLCSTCKREVLSPFGKTILSPSLNSVMVSALYAGIELTYLFPFFDQGPAL